MTIDASRIAMLYSRSEVNTKHVRVLRKNQMIPAFNKHIRALLSALTAVLIRSWALNCLLILTLFSQPVALFESNPASIIHRFPPFSLYFRETILSPDITPFHTTQLELTHRHQFGFIGAGISIHRAAAFRQNQYYLQLAGRLSDHFIIGLQPILMDDYVAPGDNPSINRLDPLLNRHYRNLAWAGGWLYSHSWLTTGIHYHHLPHATYPYSHKDYLRIHLAGKFLHHHIEALIALERGFYPQPSVTPFIQVGYHIHSFHLAAQIRDDQFTFHITTSIGTRQIFGIAYDYLVPMPGVGNYSLAGLIALGQEGPIIRPRQYPIRGRIAVCPPLIHRYQTRIIRAHLRAPLFIFYDSASLAISDLNKDPRTLFLFDEHPLSTEFSQLEHLARQMRAQNFKIELIGNTIQEPAGTGLARANRLKQNLIDQGVDDSLIEVTEKRIDPSSLNYRLPECIEEYRRVEIHSLDSARQAPMESIDSILTRETAIDPAELDVDLFAVSDTSWSQIRLETLFDTLELQTPDSTLPFKQKLMLPVSEAQLVHDSFTVKFLIRNRVDSLWSETASVPVVWTDSERIIPDTVDIYHLLTYSYDQGGC